MCIWVISMDSWWQWYDMISKCVSNDYKIISINQTWLVYMKYMNGVEIMSLCWYCWWYICLIIKYVLWLLIPLLPHQEIIKFSIQFIKKIKKNIMKCLRWICCHISLIFNWILNEIVDEQVFEQQRFLRLEILFIFM